MATRFRHVLCAAALVGGSVLVTSQVVSQDYEQKMGEMMQQWMELAQPGPEHEQMAKSAGTWKQETKHWMYPGAEPDVSTATVTLKSIMGGRFMLEKVRGTFEMEGEEMEFEGLGIFGFDNLKKKHVFSWLDNMGTMIMTAEGTADATGKIITYYSSFPDPMTGGTMEIKTVATAESDDRQVVEMFNKMPDDTWNRQMQAVMTREK